MNSYREEKAREIASTISELLCDAVHWQMDEIENEDLVGDEYVAIHAKITRRVIEFMYDDNALLLSDVKTYYIK
jgi:hypothetical protein